MHSNFFAGLAACAVSLTLTVSSALAGTITVTDTLDRTVEVPDDPHRILLGFYFEDFYAIGGVDAYDKVVAISRPAWEGWRNAQWKAYVAANPRLETLVDIGEVDAGTFSIESAIASKPDVAILAAWQYRALGEVVGKLEAAGIPVVVADYNAQTVAKHVASTLLIGRIVGQEVRAQELADAYAASVADVSARIASAATEKPVVYVELGNKGADEYGNSYGNGMWGGVIELAGGTNIAAGKIENWGALNPEYVIASNPDAIFLAGSDWLSRPKAVLMGFGVDAEVTRGRMQPYAGRPGWSGLKAVENGQVHAIYHGGARTLYDFAYLQYIAKTLHPEAFADVDPMANLKAHYDAYLPVSPDGTFMVKLTD